LSFIYGATPLHYASAKSSIENIKILVDYGAILSAKDNGVCSTIMKFFFYEYATLSLGWHNESAARADLARGSWGTGQRLRLFLKRKHKSDLIAGSSSTHSESG
jgi:hypothetical protein